MRRRTRGRGRLRLLLLAALACGSPASTVTGPGGPGSGGLVPIATTFGNSRMPLAALPACVVAASSVVSMRKLTAVAAMRVTAAVMLCR